MSGIDPTDFFRFFYRGDIDVDDDRFLIAAHDHAQERLVSIGIDLLVWHKGRNVNKIARTSLGNEL